MKKLEISSLVSNLLVFLAALAAAVPVLLGGDQLVLVAGNVAREGASVVQGVANSLLALIS